MMADPFVADISRRTFEEIAGFLYKKAGIVLTEDKLYLIESRLRPVGTKHGIDTLTALAVLMMGRGTKSEAIAADIVEAMTTNETFFFRDEKPFTHLREVVVPALARARGPMDKVRVWSAASSSGQEAYSIAMIIADSPEMAGRPVEVIGTDLSREQVDRARQGVYSHFEVQRGLPIQLLVRHFDREGTTWRIKPELRARVTFQQWNLLDNPRPLGRFDVVFCRNVLIYFDQPTKTKVLRHVAEQMAPDGFLYLGGAETIVGLQTPFVSQPGASCFRIGANAAAAQRPETIRSTS